MAKKLSEKVLHQVNGGAIVVPSRGDTWVCGDCEHEWNTSTTPTICPKCGRTNIKKKK